MRKGLTTIRPDSDRTQPSERPSIQIANAPHTTDSFRAVCLWSQLLTEIAYVKINTSIERRKFSAQHALCQRFPGKHLSWRFQECVQQIELCRRQVQILSRP